MGTTPAVPAKRGRKLAELILAESGRAGLGPGSRLPTERRLAADLGVTRSGIRLALAALEADGLISREVGRGTFLRDAAAGALAAARRGEAGVGRGEAGDAGDAGAGGGEAGAARLEAAGGLGGNGRGDSTGSASPRD